MSFQWDERKAKANLKKHGVSFEEAKSVFRDVKVRLVPDREHSDDEERFLALGMGHQSRILVVAHCYRGNAIRVFSARKADMAEVKRYYGG